MVRRTILSVIVMLSALCAFSCDSGGGDGGQADPSTGGVSADRTTVVFNKWVNAKGRAVPYVLFGLESISTGWGRALPEGLRVVLVSGPAHGALSMGNTYYTPTAGYVGEDFFTFRVIDAAGKLLAQVYKIVFKRVDAQPPLIDGFGSNWVLAAAGQYYADIVVISPGGVSVTFNSFSFTAASGTPVREPTQKADIGGGYWRFSLYGDFSACGPGAWTNELTATFTDPAGNTTDFATPPGFFTGMVVVLP